MSYPDIFRKVKADSELTGLGGSVSCIRRMQKGELHKLSEKIADSFRDQVEKVLGEQAEVKGRKQQIVIECKDLDEVTSREDIFAGLRKQFKFNSNHDNENVEGVWKYTDRYYLLAG